MNKKTIIIDKNILQGTSDQKLCDITASYTIILPHVLFEECITTQKKPGPIDLLQKAERIIKSGAFISLPLGKMLEIEKNTLHSLDTIIDMEVTQIIKENNIDYPEINFEHEATECNKSFSHWIKFAMQIAQKFWDTLSEKEYSTEWRQPSEDNDSSKRYKKWVKAFNEKTLREYIKQFYPDISHHIQNNWITWHLIQLLLVYGVEWAYKRNSSGQSYENFDITNNVYDIGYTLCLARSDALVSQDNDVKYFAEAIFPQKNIYNKLEDIS